MISVLILAAGKSTRMNSNTPKVLEYLGGRKVIDFILDTANEISDDILVVISKDIEDYMCNYKTILQPDYLSGTGGAAFSGLKHLKYQDAFIIFGDTPLLKSYTLEKMYKTHKERNNIITLASTKAQNGEYGIINIDDDNKIESILETKDNNIILERQIHNGGVMCVNVEFAYQLLCESIEKEYNQKEKFLTSIINIAYKKNIRMELFEIDFEETIGINTRQDLYKVESILQKQLREKIMQHNTVIDINSIFLSYDTELYNTIIHPFVVFGKNVKASHSTFLSHSYIENTYIEGNATIGPFASIKNSNISSHVKIGNFVEIQRSHIAHYSKIKHLSYIGDSEIGNNCNIGAGSITCNYDGISKNKTYIGNGTNIGANNSIIAPVKIGSNVITGAGSCITENIHNDTLMIGRIDKKDVRYYRNRRKNKNK